MTAITAHSASTAPQYKILRKAGTAVAAAAAPPFARRARWGVFAAAPARAPAAVAAGALIASRWAGSGRSAGRNRRSRLGGSSGIVRLVRPDAISPDPMGSAIAPRRHGRERDLRGWLPLTAPGPGPQPWPAPDAADGTLPKNLCEVPFGRNDFGFHIRPV